MVRSNAQLAVFCHFATLTKSTGASRPDVGFGSLSVNIGPFFLSLAIRQRAVNKMPDERVIVGYMDKVDFDEELGKAFVGNKVYPSIRAVKEDKPCTSECGIVEVEVRLRRVVQETDFSIGKRPTP